MSASSRRRRLSCASTASASLSRRRSRSSLVGRVAALVGLDARRRESSSTRSTVASRKSRSWETRQQRAGEAGEPLGQPGAAVGVEVVGGLVEQQHGRLAEQDRGQQAAGRLAAGQRARAARRGRGARCPAAAAPRPAAPPAPSRRAPRSAPAPRRRRRGRSGRPRARRARSLTSHTSPSARRKQVVDRRPRVEHVLRQVADAVARRRARPRRDQDDRRPPAAAAASSCRRR